MPLIVTSARFDVISTEVVLHIEQKEMISQSDLVKDSVSFPPSATELRVTRHKHFVNYKKWSLRSSPLASSDPAATIFLRRPSHFLIPLLCYYILEAFYFKRITAIGLLYFPLRFLRQKCICTIVTQYTESTVYWPGWWIFAHTAQHIPGFSYQFSDRDQGRQKP